MTTLLDLLYVALFAVAGPVIDYLVFWPAFRRRSRADPVRARTWLWAWIIGSAWVLVGVGAALWAASDRSWMSFGFSVPSGWRLWMSVALLLVLAAYQIYAIATLARNGDARANVRQQMGKLADVDVITPHKRTELYWWGGVSLTAGFCEEFLYRGYFVWVLSPWLGWWGAATLSLLFFAIGHLYQGWNGVLRTGVIGAVITLIVAISGSLWPAIALHALLDLGQGIMAWLALREVSGRGDVVAGERPTEPQSAPEVHFCPDQAESGARVTHIFVAPTRGAPMESRQVIAALTDGGLDGDRYADPTNRRGPDYQVTLIESENIAAFSKLVDIPFTPDMPRRNIVTRGIRLNELCGRQFKVGGATLEGLELCEPCGLFAKRTHRDVLKYFPRKGGLRARIVAGGDIQIGDPVVVDA